MNSGANHHTPHNAFLNVGDTISYPFHSPITEQQQLHFTHYKHVTNRIFIQKNTLRASRKMS